MALPSAFIVGLAKSGTTSVFAALSQRPGVCRSMSKEAHFIRPVAILRDSPIDATGGRFSI